MIELQELALRRGSRLLLKDTSLKIHPQQRVGVVGSNGCGKSTLFALLLTELELDAGNLSFPKQWVIAHVQQEIAINDQRPAIEMVLDGDKELRALEKKLKLAEQKKQGELIAELHDKIEVIDGYSARSKASKLMAGLGFQANEEENAVCSFSGGWQMRLNLASALMCRSDLLLLDEPTNHLDLDTVIWLETWLKNYQGTLLLISHDRDFLNQVCTHTLHFEQQNCRIYNGNYQQFERIRSEQLAGQQAAYEKQQTEIAHIESFINRFKAKASKAKQAQGRVKALERMSLIAAAHVDSPFHFEFKKATQMPRPLLKLDAVDFSYGDHLVLKNNHMVLNPGDRIGLLGANGAGKSTLIQLLAQSLQPQNGEVVTAQGLKIGYFAQHQLKQLEMQQSPLMHLQRLNKKASEQSLRDYLGGFAFRGDQVTDPIEPFSGGEKARLVLALIVYQQPNLLLLDEPTNHLDIEMRQALAQALQAFEGAMVIVSHDRHLLRTTTDNLVIVNQQKIIEFDGSIDDYPQWLATEKNKDKGVKNKSTPHSASAKKDRKRQQAENRKRLQPLLNQRKKAEQAVNKLEQQSAEIEQKLADPSLYEEQNKQQLKTLLLEQSQVSKELTEQETRWMELSETLEELETN